MSLTSILLIECDTVKISHQLTWIFRNDTYFGENFRMTTDLKVFSNAVTSLSSRLFDDFCQHRIIWNAKAWIIAPQKLESLLKIPIFRQKLETWGAAYNLPNTFCRSSALLPSPQYVMRPSEHVSLHSLNHFVKIWYERLWRVHIICTH